MSPQIRRYFHEELEAAEQSVHEMGAATQAMLEKTLRAVASADLALCDEVVASDDEVDAYYLDTERKIVDLFALQSPVASDLRLLTALLHISLHLERVADMAVNIAKIVRAAKNLPRSSTVLQNLEEMGGFCLQVIAAALHAFAERDVEECLRLPEMDDRIDKINRGMLQEVLAIADDRAMLEWAIGMHLVARQLERVGDHAVDIGEQVHFLVTGEFKEFTDASHPIID